MMTNYRLIPVESSFELRVASKLIKEGRRFTKHLRYDAANDVVFPDFILSDVGDEGIPMEVYGVTGRPAYDLRKKRSWGSTAAHKRPTGNGRPPNPTRSRRSTGFRMAIRASPRQDG